MKIRLRPARDDDSFYDWNHILGTMLHEVGMSCGSLWQLAAVVVVAGQLWGIRRESTSLNTTQPTNSLYQS